MRHFDVVALAKRINQRREEWNQLHPEQPVRITGVMSRILENDPDYLPYRRRDPAKKQRPVLNPSVRTLMAIADVLGTTVGDLLGEPWPVSPHERRMLAATAGAIRRLLSQADQSS
jgi:hypothetical protein